MVITELCDYFVFEILQSSFVLFLADNVQLCIWCFTLIFAHW